MKSHDRPLIAKVLNTLASQAEPPKPFAIKEQYKANMVQEENVETGEGEECVQPPTKKTKSEVVSQKSHPKKRRLGSRASQPKRNPNQSSAEAVEWVYSAERSKFIREMRDGTLASMSYAEAKEAWDQSANKKALLKDLTPSELIRRRFCPKGTKINPWA